MTLLEEYRGYHIVKLMNPLSAAIEILANSDRLPKIEKRIFDSGSPSGILKEKEQEMIGQIKTEIDNKLNNLHS